jgi:3-deoxy-D-manno-octulosonate 8-phosphate phosphatase (KDO 8-P phosphatase)
MPESNDPKARIPGTVARPDTLASDPIAELTGAQTDPQLGAVLAPIHGPVRILFMDLDGTLTDGVIVFDGRGDARNFWIRDGLALTWARDLGIVPVVISGRSSEAVEARMADLRIECHQGIEDKVEVAQAIIEREETTWDRCVMMGDDLPDVALMKRVGWPIAVPDAQPEVLKVAKTVTRMPGGRGAVREVVEMLLRHNGTWDHVLERYEAR